jgi:SAM-dependent methyltransferase
VDNQLISGRDSLDQASYWNGYYRSGGVPELPSQFALFVAGELASRSVEPVGAILDVGCGNGRDSVFFAQLGHAIGGLDRSEQAVAACTARLAAMPRNSSAKTLFQAGCAESGAIEELAGAFEGPLLVYSRFFFHAVDDTAEAEILGRVGKLLNQRGGTLAVEFRTIHDSDGTRETGAHYRRYVDPAAYAARLAASGLEVVWQAEGRGMAKFRSDDAHVARILARPW